MAGDDRNTAWLESTVDTYGWPSIRMVGEDGAHDAWLLVQHAGKGMGPNLAFMCRCLDLMNKLPKSEVLPKDLAYLTDRVLVSEGKKQIYGTQFNLVQGRLVPDPIEDESIVDRRRAGIGLEPLGEKTKAINDDLGEK